MIAIVNQKEENNNNGRPLLCEITYTTKASHTRPSISRDAGATAVIELERVAFKAETSLIMGERCFLVFSEFNSFPGSWRGGAKGYTQSDEIDGPFHGYGSKEVKRDIVVWWLLRWAVIEMSWSISLQSLGLALHIYTGILLLRVLILLISYFLCSVGMLEETWFFEEYVLYSFMTFFGLGFDHASHTGATWWEQSIKPILFSYSKIVSLSSHYYLEAPTGISPFVTTLMTTLWSLRNISSFTFGAITNASPLHHPHYNTSS